MLHCMTVVFFCVCILLSKIGACWLACGVINVRNKQQADIIIGLSSYEFSNRERVALMLNIVQQFGFYKGDSHWTGI